MMQTIKKIIKNIMHRNIVALGVLCVCAVGLSMWFFIGNNSPFREVYDHEALVDMNEEGVPLGNIAASITAGDIVVVNITAAEMDAVYGYQFDINYDRDYLEYKNRLYSDIDEIITIFAADKEWYLLVGATMIGDASGYSGLDVPVCRLEFVALSDFDLKTDSSSEHITISNVNVVKDDLQYLENVDGWTASISVTGN